MSHSRKPGDRREFNCEHCGGQILIPWDLPPTTGPCPHCAKTITSPEAGPRLSLPNRRNASKSRKPSLNMDLTGSSTATDDPDAGIEPIKLDASQHAEPPTRQKKISPPKKVDPTKPVISRHLLAEDQSSGPVYNEFEKMLIEETQRHKRKIVIIFTLLIPILGFASYLCFEYFDHLKKPSGNPDSVGTSNSTLTQTYIQGAWEKEAREVLRAYLVATTTYGKLPYILNGHPMLREIEMFYEGAIINDLDTPVEEFSVKPLAIADSQRGLFRMAFQAKPGNPQPRKPNELSNKQLVYPDEVDDQPTSIHAFFKHTPNGLKLDWSVFAQTKYRTLLHFARQPNPRRKASFRVLITQDKPATDQSTTHPLRYRIADPANGKDVIWASANDTPQTSQLREIHWINHEGQAPVTRSATIELAWTGEGDARELIVYRFICWEFLGLGSETPANQGRNH